MDIINSSISTVNPKESPNNIVSFAARIGDNVTEFVVVSFRNQDLLVITQFFKIASLYKVEIDNPDTDLNITETVYSVSHISGSENPKALGAVRFLAEKLNLKKTTNIFLDLKAYEKSDIIGIVEAVSKKLNNGSC